MCYLNLKIGDEMPLEGRFAISGNRKLIRDGVAASVWFPLKVAPGKELAAIKMLKAKGITAFCPMEPTKRVFRGKIINGEKPTVTQIVYAKFSHEPQWHALQERRIATGVYCQGSRPIELPKDAIRILRGLRVTAERLKAAKEKMLRVEPGEKVEVIGGPFEGFFAEVTECRNGRVWWKTLLENGLQVNGESAVDWVKKQNVA